MNFKDNSNMEVVKIPLEWKKDIQELSLEQKAEFLDAILNYPEELKAGDKNFLKNLKKGEFSYFKKERKKKEKEPKRKKEINKNNNIIYIYNISYTGNINLFIDYNITLNKFLNKSTLSPKNFKNNIIYTSYYNINYVNLYQNYINYYNLYRARASWLSAEPSPAALKNNKKSTSKILSYQDKKHLIAKGVKITANSSNSSILENIKEWWNNLPFACPIKKIEKCTKQDLYLRIFDCGGIDSFKNKVENNLNKIIQNKNLSERKIRIEFILFYDNFKKLLDGSLILDDILKHDRKKKGKINGK